MTHTHMHTHAHRPHPCAQMHKRTHAHTHTSTLYMHTERERNKKMLIQFDCLLGHTSNQPKKLSTGMHAPDDGIGHDIITTTRQHPQMSMSTVPMQQVWPERSQKCIRQAANNGSQPCQRPSHQIHRISRGTPPWTSDPLGLPSARLSSHHHQSQRGGPPSWGQGTQQQEDGRPWHTSERHCVLPALNNKNRLTTDHHLCTHAGCTLLDEGATTYVYDGSMHVIVLVL